MDDAIGRGVLRCDYRDVGASTRYVTLSGEADLATADQLEDDLRRLLAPSWVTCLALDLTALRHLDCAALAALLAVRETAVARGEQIVVTAAVGAAARVLVLGGVGELFDNPPLSGRISQMRTAIETRAPSDSIASSSAGSAH
ncbi:STAS domain-containing protein [Micromonospora sp. NPDC094482]|uniref:STAS domain-containing protein n=1 Tax=unclassified Micromonospora TaxID=2617518 RepID=UPI00332954EA